MRITALHACTCPVPLPRPINLGPITYRTRDYVALKLETDAGVEGHALAYTRGMPLTAMLEAAGPWFVGEDPSRHAQLLSDFRRAHLPAWAAVQRVTSLLDIALWDLAARVAQRSLADLLGRVRDSVPLIGIGGYWSDSRTPEDIAEEALALASGGVSAVKLVLDGLDAQSDHALLAGLREQLGDGTGLAIDAHALWATPAEALAVLQPLDAIGLAFIEDPFAPAAWRATAELAERMTTPLATGEDATGLAHYEEVLDAAAILRVDATASGGVSEVRDACRLATACGKPAIPHVYPGLHAQIAGATPAISAVEAIPPECGADPVERLMARQPEIRDGAVVIDDRPGAGTELDWERVEGLAAERRSVRVPPSAT